MRAPPDAGIGGSLAVWALPPAARRQRNAGVVSDAGSGGDLAVWALPPAARRQRNAGVVSDAGTGEDLAVRPLPPAARRQHNESVPPSTLPTADAAAAAVIDLGDAGTAWAADVDGGPAGLPRGWGLLLALGLTMSLVAAVPVRAGPAEIARQPLRNGTFQLAGDVLLVLERDRTPTPVEAFGTGDGQSRWTYTPDGLATLSYAAVAPGAADVVVLWPDLCSSGVTGTTVAVDRRTGREVWQAPGVPVRTPPGVPGTVIMRSLWSDGCGALAANAPTGGALRWQALGPGGEVRWEIPVDAGTRVAVDSAEAGASWAALADKQGAVAVADFVTGRRGPAGSLTAGPGDLVAAAGDLLVLAEVAAAPAREATVLTAYRRGAWSSPAWRVSVPTVPASGRTDRFTVRPCGPALCATGQRTFVLDPATGAVRWSPGGNADLVTAPGGMLTEPGVRTPHLFDPATGAEAPVLAGWEVLGADGGRLLLGTPTGEDATLVGVRAGDQVTPLGTVDARLTACELDGDRVACATETGEVVLLRLAT